MESNREKLERWLADADALLEELEYEEIHTTVEQNGTDVSEEQLAYDALMSHRSPKPQA